MGSNIDKQLCADLAAANREVRAVMDKNAALLMEAAEAYAKGYRDAMSVAADLANTNEQQAQMIVYLTQAVAKGLTVTT